MAFSAALLSALGMAGCGGKSLSENMKTADNAFKDSARATGKAVGDTARETGEFFNKSKDMAVKEAHEMLASIEKKWQELEAKTASGTEEAKADIRKAKEQMEITLGDVKEKLIQAKDAAGEVWQDTVKPSLEAALLKARKLYEDTADKFKGT
jgi:hypothetical protein